jgi:hypothetical protein
MERDNFARYKILEGILRLRRFTVAELAKATLTEEGTIRKFLDRNKDLVSPLGKVPVEGPGGRSMTYEVLFERLEALREQLDVLYRLGVSAHQQPIEAPPPLWARYGNNLTMHPLVTDLLASEGLLLKVFPTASTVEERVECIHAGEITLKGVIAALGDQLDRRVREVVNAHLSLLDGLVELSKVELKVVGGAALQLVASEVGALPTSFAQVSWDVIGEAGVDILNQIVKRIGNLVRPLEDAPLTHSPSRGAEDRLQNRSLVQRQRLQYGLARPDVQIALLGLKGRWVAFDGKQVIANAESANGAYALADSHGTYDPLVFRIPDRPLITIL